MIIYPQYIIPILLLSKIHQCIGFSPDAFRTRPNTIWDASSVYDLRRSPWWSEMRLRSGTHLNTMRCVPRLRSETLPHLWSESPPEMIWDAFVSCSVMDELDLLHNLHYEINDLTLILVFKMLVSSIWSNLHKVIIFV